MSEATVSWRAWSLARPHFLSSPNLVWMPREPLEAYCAISGGSIISNHGIISPDARCTCGVYSVKDRQALANYFSIDPKTIREHRNVPPAVIGQVKIWGKVLEHSRGYRSQFAYPAKLWVLDKDWAPLSPLLADMYGVPVEVGLPKDFPTWVSEKFERVNPNLPQSDPTPGSLQYSVVRSELSRLMGLAEDTTVAGQIAAVLLENLDDDFAVHSKDLFKALVEAKEAGRVKTRVHPWRAFEVRKAAFKLLTRYTSRLNPADRLNSAVK